MRFLLRMPLRRGSLIAGVVAGLAFGATNSIASPMAESHQFHGTELSACYSGQFVESGHALLDLSETGYPTPEAAVAAFGRDRAERRLEALANLASKRPEGIAGLEQAIDLIERAPSTPFDGARVSAFSDKVFVVPDGRGAASAALGVTELDDGSYAVEAVLNCVDATHVAPKPEVNS